jgi:hypothetical protein
VLDTSGQLQAPAALFSSKEKSLAVPRIELRSSSPHPLPLLTEMIDSFLKVSKEPQFLTSSVHTVDKISMEHCGENILNFKKNSAGFVF